MIKFAIFFYKKNRYAIQKIFPVGHPACVEALRRAITFIYGRPRMQVHPRADAMPRRTERRSVHRKGARLRQDQPLGSMGNVIIVEDQEALRRRRGRGGSAIKILRRVKNVNNNVLCGNFFTS